MQSVIVTMMYLSSRSRHTIFDCDCSSDVCSSDLGPIAQPVAGGDPAGPLVVVLGIDDQVVEPRRRAQREHVGDAERRRERDDRDQPCGSLAGPDRKSVVEGKSGDLGGRRIIKKKT